jgi:23S rRNA (guanosine2251-2'-O)-methyltransferase
MRKLLNEELNTKSIVEFQDSGKMPFVLVLDNVRSGHNIGSVFRTCDAFLVESVYLCGFTAKPPNAEIHKSALGAENSVKWHYFETTEAAICSLQQEGYQIVSIEQVENSISLKDFKPEKGKKYALVFGNEIKGVSQEIVDISDYSIEIPQFGTKHSFNISVSAGIVLWDLYIKYTSL